MRCSGQRTSLSDNDREQIETFRRLLRAVDAPPPWKTGDRDAAERYRAWIDESREERLGWLGLAEGIPAPAGESEAGHGQ